MNKIQYTVLILLFFINSCFANTAQQEEYKNDYLYSDAYFDYLIECASDEYQKQVEQEKHEQESIEQASLDDIKPSETNLDEKANLSEIVNGEVEFYAHCVTKWGVKMNLWEKVGNNKEIGALEHILFRDTNDYGCKVGEEPVKISSKWYVWHINDENFTRVGKLVGENRNAEIGVVVNPYDIVARIKTGKYNFIYPSFE